MRVMEDSNLDVDASVLFKLFGFELSEISHSDVSFSFLGHACADLQHSSRSVHYHRDKSVKEVFFLFFFWGGYIFITLQQLKNKVHRIKHTHTLTMEFICGLLLCWIVNGVQVQ